MKIEVTFENFKEIGEFCKVFGEKIAATAPQQQPVQQPVQQQPSQVPTSQKEYTLDELSVAAATLMDAGRQQELLALLQKYGVKGMFELQQAQYGAFATDLRAMGAKI